MQTTVAPSEIASLPMPQVMSVATVTAVVAPGESGGGAFIFGVPGVETIEHTVADGDTWSLTFQNLGVVSPSVKNTGSTSLVFTTPDGV